MVRVESYPIGSSRPSERSVPIWGVDETDRTCESLEVVRFWINAYGRMLDFDERLLATIQERVETLPTVVRVEAEMTNIPVQEGQVERVRGRLDFWHRREAELLRGH